MEWLRKLLVFLQTNPPPSLEAIGDGLPGPGDKRRIRLAIIIGHEKKAQGANMVDPFKVSEYQYNTQVSNYMTEYIDEKDMPIEPVVIFRDGIGIVGTYAKAEREKCDVAIELHFNAFNGAATGSECLSSAEEKDKELAGLVLRGVCGVFQRGGLSRGVKVIPRADRGGLNVNSFPGGANCLVEPFFGDTFSEAEAGLAKQRNYAQALVDAVLLWARKKDLV